METIDRQIEKYINGWESIKVEKEYKITSLMKEMKMSFEDAEAHLEDLEILSREEERMLEEERYYKQHPERDSLWDITGGVR